MDDKELDLLLQYNPDLRRCNQGLLNVRQLAEQASTRGNSKYHNIKTSYAGRTFDSKKEAKRAQELDLLKQAGEVLAWFPQVSFDLAAGIKYKADFVVIWKDWTVTVEDVKSPITRREKSYRMKKKLFAERYGREIVER